MNERRKYIRKVGLKSPGFANEDSYLAKLPAIQFFATGNELIFQRPVTFLVGENGTGKSTLLEAIAVSYGFNAEGGTRNFNFSTNETHSNLHNNIYIAKEAYPKDGFFFRAESFYNAASYIHDIGVSHNYGEKALHEQSHGESFLSLIQHRFKGNGLYLLDEPEAALSPGRLLTLLVCIHNLVQNNSQFIIVTHSPIVMAYPDSQIYEFTDCGISKVKYYDTEHYQLTRRFLENPERMLSHLLDQ